MANIQYYSITGIGGRGKGEGGLWFGAEREGETMSNDTQTI